ncbi:Fc.00g065690.m01.CDS01 [Cosmosporella sp. VM-42]
MSAEEQELLARIGQLAGQINRHKNQQTGQRPVTNHHPAHHRHNAYRHTTAPYPSRGHRIGRPPAVHQHRTLNLNAAGNSSTHSPASDGSQTPTGWVSRNARHRQLINANVYEKDSQNRTKAIEATRQRKLDSQRHREKTQFNEFLKHQSGTASAPTNPTSSTGPNELTIEGIQFRVLEGGKKLVKLPDVFNASFHTPKTAIVAGVKFHRTKTGNLVAHRIVKDQRRSGVVRKVNEPCKIFSTTGNFSFQDRGCPDADQLRWQGSCPKGPQCRYIHDPNKVALCKDFLKEGKCANGESCDLSHDMTPERTPNCLHFAKGHCSKPDCPYTHSKAPPSALVCRAFGFNGYCDKGADCTERHVLECPDFSNTGRCKIRGCKLLHRERASVLRQQANDTMEDLSSDEEAPDSDDVDSDEVAEFIDADSDDSDFEDRKEFISL